MSTMQIILKEIEHQLITYLDTLENQYGLKYSLDFEHNRIEIRGQTVKTDNFKMFFFSIFDKDEEGPGQIALDTLFLPFEVRHNGIVLKLMDITYQIAEKHRYTTIVVGMVEGFYNALVRRGAYPLNYETVQIVGRTNLKK
ncbi:hypothetical protein [Paenibacillus macquariensis]|uniref:N-acetyltransferase domain-containing protein n=1 Tax=Paenibacillus macquariensis TaxID=948756 RepID=A0ABY1KHL5_9BACL|nr:hypothetical protein [Paenibacillus macquariensis]OAB29601.1 hypothetical protein PMSM_23745 [Paenibacillus macquariensis subsp. macquariensis]SIR73582.1 hypothetical protein SAMN05421578_1532 [Paenibacillus macquariensis]